MPLPSSDKGSLGGALEATDKRSNSDPSMGESAENTLGGMGDRAIRLLGREVTLEEDGAIISERVVSGSILKTGPSGCPPGEAMGRCKASANVVEKRRRPLSSSDGSNLMRVV